MVGVATYIIISVIIVSLVSFIGIVTLFFTKKRVENLLLMLISISAGTLFGGAFFHLIPGAVEKEGYFRLQNFYHIRRRETLLASFIFPRLF